MAILACSRSKPAATAALERHGDNDDVAVTSHKGVLSPGYSPVDRAADSRAGSGPGNSPGAGGAVSPDGEPRGIEVKVVIEEIGAAGHGARGKRAEATAQ